MNSNSTITVFEANNRLNAAGKSMGRRVSFLAEAPAGDIRKALKDQGLKGKALTTAVDKVLRGDSTMGWACLHASMGRAQSLGFTPVVWDLNKAETKLTIKLERPSVALDHDAALHAAKTQLTDEELMALVAERAEKKADAKSIEA